MQAAEQDVKQKKDVAENHLFEVPKYRVEHRTKIVNSPEYIKRINRRRHQRDVQVGYILRRCLFLNDSFLLL